MAAQLTPSDLKNFIERESINAQLIDEIGATPTVPAAAQALGVATDQIVKTLLFLVKQPGEPAAEPQPVVVISHGERLVDRKPLAARFGVGRKRIKLAPADVVLELLGYPAGGVPPLGHRTKLPMLLDASVVSLGEQVEETVIYGGGGDAKTMLKLTVAELLRVVQPEVIALSEG